MLLFKPQISAPLALLWLINSRSVFSCNASTSTSLSASRIPPFVPMPRTKPSSKREKLSHCHFSGVTNSCGEQLPNHSRLITEGILLSDLKLQDFFFSLSLSSSPKGCYIMSRTPYSLISYQSFPAKRRRLPNASSR